MTEGIKGSFHYDRHSGDVYIGDTELVDWLLGQFRQGTHLSVHVTELETPKDMHIRIGKNAVASPQ